MRLGWKIFIIVQIALLICIMFFPIYRSVMNWIPDFLTGCSMLEIFHIYCPLCGATRAVDALLQLNILQALKSHAYIVLLFFVFVGYDITAFIRLIQKKKVIVTFPVWLGVLLPSLFIIWFLSRNFLVVFCGIDTLGDINGFWQQVRDGIADMVRAYIV